MHRSFRELQLAQPVVKVSFPPLPQAIELSRLSATTAKLAKEVRRAKEKKDTAQQAKLVCAG